MSSSPPTGQATDAPAPVVPPESEEPRSLRIEDWLTVIVMAALALITFANVLVRYFTSSSFAWTEEISVFLMIVLALVAGSAAVARDRHIRIEYYAEGGSPERRRRLAQLGAVAVALLFALIAVLSVRVVWDDYRFGETVISALIAARSVGLLLRRSREPVQGDTPVPGKDAQP
jgi:TRAP-type C4-dicarboxylate transport system permease small subunit